MMTVIDHIINGVLALATIGLIYATMFDSHRTIVEVVSMFLGRSGAIGRHSRWAAKERARDKHSHADGKGKGRCASVPQCLDAVRAEDKHS